MFKYRPELGALYELGDGVNGGSEEIQVFEDAGKNRDLHSMSEDEREIALGEIFKDSPASAKAFMALIRGESHLRGAFRVHNNADVMARQIVAIAQDRILFARDVVVPSVEFAAAYDAGSSGSPFADALKRNNPPTGNSSAIIKRVTARARENTSATVIKARAHEHMEVQFRGYTNAVEEIHGDAVRCTVSPADSVFVKKLSVVPIGAGPGAPYKEMAADNVDLAGERKGGAGVSAILMDIYSYLRFRFIRDHSARDIFRIETRRCAESATGAIKVVENIPARMAALIGLVGVDVDLTFSTNVPAMFYLRGLSRLYVSIIYGEGGPESRSVRRLVAAERELANRAVMDAKIRRERIRAESEIQLARGIIDKYLPGETAAKVGRLARGVKLSDILAILGPKDRAFVNQKISAETSAAKRERSNCEHERAIDMLREAQTIDSIRAALALVAKFAKNESADGEPALMNCTVCGAKAIICPHTVAMATAAATHASDKNMRNELWSYVVSVRESGLRYCRLCGEVFDAAETEDDDEEKAEERDADLLNEIYREMHVVMRFVTASKVLDVQRFRNSIVDRIYQHVDQRARKTYVSKAGATSEMMAKIKLHIIVMIYAALIIDAEPAGLIFADYKGAVGASHIGALVQYARDKIATVANVVIGSIQGMTRDQILEMLVNAVKLLRSDGYVVEKPRASDYRDPLSYDPIFTMLVRGSPAAKALPADEIEPFGLGSLSRALLPPKPLPIIYEPLFAGARSHLRYVQNMIAVLSSRAYQYPIDEGIDSKIRTLREKIAKDNAEMRAADAEAKAAAKPLWQVATRAVSRPRGEMFTPRPEALSYVYDESGRPHRWDIFVVDDGKSVLELKKGAQEFATDAGVIRHITDRKCSVCGVLYSRALKTLDEAKVREAIAAQVLFENFFRFFEMRCPEGGAHVFNVGGAKTVCSRCGYYAGLGGAGGAGGADADTKAYFDKYAAAFVSEQETPARKPSADTSAAERERAKESAAKLAQSPWSFDMETVVSAAASLGVEKNFMLTLGAKESAEHGAMLDGSWVPHPARSRADARIGALRSYIIEVVTHYTIMLNHSTSTSRAGLLFIESITKRAGSQPSAKNVPQFETIAADALSAFLPANTNRRLTQQEFLSYVMAIGETLKPTAIVEHHLQLFCAMIMAIKNAGGAICAAFAKEIFDKIVTLETIAMKADHFSISVVSGTLLYRQGVGSDTGEVEEFGDENGDDQIAAADADGDDDPDGAADSLRLDVFDVEGQENNGEDGIPDMGVDPDEAAVTLHIGGEIGW